MEMLALPGILFALIGLVRMTVIMTVIKLRA
jgi:hypothetical protein